MRGNQILTLFVAGRRHRSVIDTLRELVRRESGGHLALRVIDVTENPDEAEKNNILATPTLVCIRGKSARRIIGDFTNTSLVALWLRNTV